MTKAFCFFFIFFIKDTSFQQIQRCQSDWSAKYNITWPETSNMTLSEPPCVNEDKEFLYRRCLNGFWDSEPECSYIQEKSPPNCPEDFIFSENLSICYQIISQTFPPKCLFEDILPFDSYKNIIGDNNGPVWMPVARNLKNGLGFFYWIEASSNYGSYFDEKYVFKDSIKDKNCLLYYNDTYIEAVYCDETHAGVCAYKPLNQVDDSLCFSADAYVCYRSDFATNSSCLCYGNSTNDYPKAEFLKPYQNSIYGRLTNETCSMGLEKNQNGTYIWSYSKEEINYTYWSKDTVFDGTHIYGASTPSGWILIEKQAECAVFLKEKKIPNPYISLSFHDTNKKFKVKITDVRGVKFLDSKILLRCFTDVDAFDLITRLPIINQPKINQNEWEFTFDPLGTTPGSYWCETFKYENNKPISTYKYTYASNSLLEFVSILKVNYNKRINPLSKDLISLLNNSLFYELDTVKFFKDSYIARIMSIEDIDEAKAEALVNIHFTQTNTNSNNTFEEEYLSIETLLKTTLDRLVGVRIEFINIFSTDYCMKETTKLTWPTTQRYRSADSEEFCIYSNGYQASRYCSGDFDRGARWSEPDEDCTIFKKSSYTEDLKNVSQNTENFDISASLGFLHSIQDQNYQPIDLYLISNIFLELRDMASNLDQAIITPFAEIVNNLLETTKEVLSESQSKLNATDTMLEAITATLVDHPSPCDIQRSNLYFKSVEFFSSEVNGIMIVQNDNVTITPIIGDCSKTEIQATENLRGAVCLSPQLLKQGVFKIVITIYFKDSLFNNEIQTVAPIDTIFGITFTDDNKVYLSLNDPIQFGNSRPLSDPIWVFQPFRGDNTNCFYWDFYWDSRNPLPGIWRKESESMLLDHLQFCQFYRTGHFVFTEELNVTTSLMNILSSNASASEIMVRLTEVSKRHYEFASIDVFLVGKIFEKVNKLNKTNKAILENLAEIVNNLQEIQRETLLESQIIKSATDNILQEIDKMLQGYNYELPVNIIDEDLFKIFIYDTKTTNFSGIMLIESGKHLKTHILIGDRKIEDIASTENLNSAIVISPELKNQLKEDGKVIVTITPTDSLFNERKSRFKNVSKIFGVILPKTEKFNGPISVLYKMDQSSSQQDCVHWLYGQKQNSFWSKDQESESLSSLNYCKFWHTTHFALLLLDYDEQNDFLDWITAFNSALSLFGLSCVIFTGIKFRKWRSNGGNQILLNFVLVMILQIIFFFTSSIVSQNDYSLCTCIGILLHFFTISEFLWMLVIAFLQYRRFVRVFGGPPQHILLKSCILGWIFPLFLVMCVFLIDQNNYVNSNVGLCYPSGLGLYLGVWLPVSLILITNFIIFVCIIYNVAYNSSECGNIKDDEAIFKWRLGILLFSMLGLTWIFGLLADIEKIFIYLFCVTATLQGFVIFVFFIIFNVETKLLYSKTLKKCCSKNV